MNDKILFDYKEEFHFVLNSLGFGQRVIDLVTNAYRNISDGSATFYNYYRFGRYFQLLRNSIQFRNITPLQRLELNESIDKLEAYIIPQMFIQKNIDF